MRAKTAKEQLRERMKAEKEQLRERMKAAKEAATRAEEARRRLLAEEQKRLFREAAARQQQRQSHGAAACPHAAGANGVARLPPLGDLPAAEVADWVLRDHQGCAFQCLGLEPHAPPEVCRKRYLHLAFLLHPDKFDDSRATAAFAAIDHANDRILRTIHCSD